MWKKEVNKIAVYMTCVDSVYMIAKDLQPLSTMEDEGLKKYPGVLDPKHQLLTRYILWEKEFVPRSQKNLCQPGASSSPLSSEHMSASGFLVVTAHFWDEQVKGL